jgi:hypothetical protein
MILWNSPGAMQAIYRAIDRLLTLLAFDDDAIMMMKQCYNLALFGKT